MLSLLGAVDGGGFFWVPCVCGCCCHTYSNLIIYFQHSLSLRKSEKPCNNRIEEQCGEMASTFNARRALIRNFFAQCPVVAAVCLNYISQNVKLFTLCRESTYCSNKPFIVIANIKKMLFWKGKSNDENGIHLEDKISWIKRLEASSVASVIWRLLKVSRASCPCLRYFSAVSSRGEGGEKACNYTHSSTRNVA